MKNCEGSKSSVESAIGLYKTELLERDDLAVDEQIRAAHRLPSTSPG